LEEYLRNLGLHLALMFYFKEQQKSLSTTLLDGEMGLYLRGITLSEKQRKSRMSIFFIRNFPPCLQHHRECHTSVHKGSCSTRFLMGSSALSLRLSILLLALLYLMQFLHSIAWTLRKQMLCLWPWALSFQTFSHAKISAWNPSFLDLASVRSRFLIFRCLGFLRFF